MSDPSRNPFDALLDAFRQIVAEELAKALDKKNPVRLLFTAREAAAMLSVKKSWLEAKAREGKIPHRMLGHYRYFSLVDIEAIIEAAVGHPEPLVIDNKQHGQESSRLLAKDRQQGRQGGKAHADARAGEKDGPS